MTLLSPIGSALNATGNVASWTMHRASDTSALAFGTVGGVATGVTHIGETVNNGVFGAGRAVVGTSVNVIGGVASATLGPVGDVISGALHVGGAVADGGLGLVQGAGNLALGTARIGAQLVTEAATAATGFAFRAVGATVHGFFHALGSIF